jgi:hypothetical protein
MKHALFWIVFVALLVLHHDWWYWDDATLVFGFLPVGLLYHALISLAAGGLWAWAVFGVWPEIFEATPEEIAAGSSAQEGEGRS